MSYPSSLANNEHNNIGNHRIGEDELKKKPAPINWFKQSWNIKSYEKRIVPEEYTRNNTSVGIVFSKYINKYQIEKKILFSKSICVQN